MFLPQLPITFVFGRPTRLELLGLSGCALLVVSAVAWARTAAQAPPPAPAEPPPPETVSEVVGAAAVFREACQPARARVRKRFWVEPFEREEAVCDRDECDVVVPAAEGAAFEVVEAERVFELAVVLLDPPAQAEDALVQRP